MTDQLSLMFGLATGGRRSLVFAGLLAAGVSACSRPAGPPPQMPPVPVEMLTLEMKPVEQTGEFVGTIKSRRSSTIQPQAEGFLTNIMVKSGDRVRIGTPLFEIDATTQQAAVASLEMVRAARESDATWARQQTERLKKLLAAGAVSEQEYEQAVAQQRTAEAQLKAVEEQIRQQKAELAFHRVTSQSEGVVGDVPVRVGDRVTRSTVLTTISDNATGLELYVNVPVQEAPKLKLGLPVRIANETGELIATEKVSFIAPSVNDDTQTVLVKTPIDSSKGSFRSDQFVRARIVWSVNPGLTVPIVSLNRVSGVYFAFVAEKTDKGLVARQRQVTIGPVVGNDYVVLGGLTAGDRLIVSGIQKIADQAPVQEAPHAPPQGAGGRGGK